MGWGEGGGGCEQMPGILMYSRKGVCNAWAGNLCQGYKITESATVYLDMSKTFLDLPQILKYLTCYAKHFICSPLSLAAIASSANIKAG